MKKISILFLCLIGLITVIASCSDDETYADKLKKERAAISKYIADSNVTVISESQFYEQDSTTDVSKNEFVLFSSSGVYMQIVRKGCGEKLQNGETANVLLRFTERNLLTDSLLLSNENLYYSAIVDKMTVMNTSGTYRGSFISGSSLMATYYGTTSVPGGWLVPLAYINLGRPASDDDEIARVRLIVPSEQGTSTASSSVYPCLYDISYERGR